MISKNIERERIAELEIETKAKDMEIKRLNELLIKKSEQLLKSQILLKEVKTEIQRLSE